MTQIEQLLKDYLDYLEIEKNRSPKTREAYERYLRTFIKKAGIETVGDITSSVVKDFRVHLARPAANSRRGTDQPLKKASQSYYVIALRNFLKYLIKQNINVLPPETIELPQVPRRDIEVLNYNELERLLDAPKDGGLRSLRDKAILETLFSTGLRVSELCSLNRYIDLERSEIPVRGKGEKLRIVFLSPSAKTAIKKYLNKRTDAEEKLFISLTRKGRFMGKIGPRAVQRMVERYAKKAGIPKKVHPHQLRHSYATDLLINGADLRAVQELLGHANVSTTQMYTHLTNKELREVHEAFHARRRK